MVEAVELNIPNTGEHFTCKNDYLNRKDETIIE
jgi:hypothetical protein